MISHKYKTIFIHLPKCAGTSIEHAFGHSDEYLGRSSQDHRSIREIQPVQFKVSTFSKENLNILRRRLLCKYAPSVKVNPNNYLTLNADEYDDYFKFTIVDCLWLWVTSHLTTSDI